MGRVEDVTLPARFLTTTAHLIATLTIVYDAVRARANALSARGPGPPLRAARASPESLNGNGNVRCAFFELAGTRRSGEASPARARDVASSRARRVDACLTLSVNPTILATTNERQEDTTRRALGSDQTDLASWQSNLEGLAWTSLIFFAVEFAGMFTGVSLFMPTANAYYIFSHFFGAVFVGLFVCLNWEIASYHWFFTLFSFFPALCETALAFAVTQMSVMQYK